MDVLREWGEVEEKSRSFRLSFGGVWGYRRDEGGVKERKSRRRYLRISVV